MLRKALFEVEGPVAVRYPRGGEGPFTDDTSGEPLLALRDGKDAVIVTYGTLVNEALEAAERLEKTGMDVSVIKLNRIAPLDGGLLEKHLGACPCFISLEDCFDAGCIGRQIVSILAERGCAPAVSRFLNVGSRFAQSGTVSELRAHLGLDADGVVRAVKEALSHEQ